MIFHIPMVFPAIVDDPTLLVLKRQMARARGVVHASGLWGSSAPMVVAHTADPSPAPWLYVTSHHDEADNALDDIELFSNRQCLLFPAWESLPGEGAGSGEIEVERFRVLTLLRRLGVNGAGEGNPIIVAPVQALMQPVPTVEALSANVLHLAAQDTRGTEFVLEWAVSRGYERLDLVESPGDVARRGDIVDIFALGETSPFRVQFLDDEIESIRRFDVSTQRSSESVSAVDVPAASAQTGPHGYETTDLLAYLPNEAVVVLDDPAAIAEMGETFVRRLGSPEGLFDVTAILERVDAFVQIHLSRFGAAATESEETFHFDVKSLTRFEGEPDDALAELCSLAWTHQVYVLCDNEGERKRLAQMLAEVDKSVSQSIHLLIGVMHRGFEWVAGRTVVVAHHEIFHRYRQRRRIRRTEAARPIDSWTDLTNGDLVVHVVHGIAIYRGLKTMRKGKSSKQEEYLVLEFADTANVYVPTSQIDLVQKYIGAAGLKPTLSKLGGQRWKKAKQRVAKSVGELAEALLLTQAVRDSAPGAAYPADTEWQREFEASFIYEETEDQLIVAEEIKGDLARPRPMDRLVCGDVGYGKTELAIRAAFKIVEYGRQVVLLVPTTVLAEQHYETFRERMADYPFIVGCLSRFRTGSEQKRLISMAKKGQVDVLIGTHRLLSKDVGFVDLGLVIIDEEQRFGVEHKERLKQLRETVDVLTMTATPIPRTLHMAMIGIRDISSLQTPPVDRRSIATQIVSYSAKLIRDAVLREMNRDGQVFFVHNYVRSIQSVADDIRKIVPEARVIVGHGQMKDGELEEVMHRFVRRDADVLVATTIIESGIDIPTTNTILINRADRFGLADLHQLRGRVGRSSHRAYCYLLLPQDRPLTVKAARRLKAVEEFSELGSGFRIAMRDLEIRGAGNILGGEQSGHIAAVGYDMYCRLLERAVRQLKNEPDSEPPNVHLELDVHAQIPRNYISSERARMEIYRRLVSCRVIEDIEQLQRDLVDAFGPVADQVRKLLELAQIRVYARRFTVRSIILKPPDVVFTIESMAAAQPLFEDAPGTVRWPDPQTIHLRLPPKYLEPNTLVPVLRRMMIRATEEVETT